MRIAAGVLGIVFGIASLGWAAWANAIGMGYSSLGGLFGASSIQTDGSEIQFLSWSAPILALTGAGFTFARPGIGASLMGLSVVCFWSLLTFSVVSALFAGQIIGLSFTILIAAGMAAFATSDSGTVEAQGESSKFDLDSGDGIEPPSIQPRTGSPQSTLTFNRTRWNSLLEYDKEIAAAAEKIRPYGKKWEDELGYSFLALNDKTYLPEIVEKLSVRARDEAEKLAFRARAEMEEIERLKALDAKRIEERREAIEKAAQERRERIARITYAVWGTVLRKILVVSNLVLITLVASYFVYQATRDYTEDIVWSPSQQVHDSLPYYSCPQFTTEYTCLKGIMKTNGAPADAISFSAAIQKLDKENVGYASKYFPDSHIDAVQVTFPWPPPFGGFGYFFVNGHPKIVDGTNWGAVSGIDLTHDPVYANLASAHPMLSMWGPAQYVGQQRTPDGNVGFVIAYQLKDCHACAALAYALFSFNFDQSGTYQGVTGSADYTLPDSALPDLFPFREEGQAPSSIISPTHDNGTQTPGATSPNTPITSDGFPTPSQANVNVPAPAGPQNQNSQPENGTNPTASPAPPAQAKQTITGHIDSYSVDGWPIIAGQIVPLFGIDGIAPSSRPGFDSWLSSLGNQLICTPPPSNLNRNDYQCRTPRGVDIAEGAILNGAGRATTDAPQLYQDAQQQASAAKRGIWQ